MKYTLKQFKALSEGGGVRIERLGFFASAQRITCKAGTRTVGTDEAGNTFYRETCSRCHGQGYLRGYEYVQAGVCFKCGGQPAFGPWISQEAYEANEAKKEAARVKRQEAKARKLAKEAEGNLQAVLAVHGQDLFAGLSEDSPAFVRDIRNKAVRFGSISEAQASAVRHALAPKAPVEASAAPVTPTAGRQVLSGVVVSFKTVETPYGRTQKMLVQFEGFRLFGSVPSGFEANIGEACTFTATVEPKEPGFGFFSRPKA